MKRSFLATILLAGCATQDLPQANPALDALAALPAAQFAATLGLARDISQSCADFGYNVAARDLALQKRGISVAAPTPIIAVEKDVTTRSFQAKHDIVVGQDNTCAAIRTELAEGSAISAVFVPA